MAVAAMAASCVSNPNKKAAADSTATAQTADVEEGFVAIFDGKTFDGWRGYNRTDVPSAWTIEDGCIKINESGMGEAGAKDGGDIIFANKKFKNFELAFDWKVDKGANSGVFYLAQEIPNQPIYISAPEYQVLDETAELETVRRMEYGQNPRIRRNRGSLPERYAGRGIPLVDPEVERDARQQQIQQGQMAGSLRTAAELRR